MEHGTIYAYTRKSCRCDECRSAKRAYQNVWREKHPGYQRDWMAAHPGYHADRWERCGKDENDQRRIHHYRWMRAIKSAQGCTLCGRKQGTLAHHHVVGPKRYEVSQMANCSLDDIIDEIAKCVVLCDSCHGRWHTEWRLMYGSDRPLPE